VNAQHLYYWQEKNFGKSEGKLSFVNSLKRLVFNDAQTRYLKGHMIDNDVHIFGRKCPSWLQVITNIKIIGLKDQILLLQVGDRDISRLTSLHPSSHLRSPLMHMQNFLSESQEFYKKWR